MYLLHQICQCDCGFGNGYYHYGHDAHHEFNPEKPETIATEQYYEDRDPLAFFYGDKSGRYAVLFFGYGNRDKPEIFKYSEYGDKKAAYYAIAQRIKTLWQQPELF